MPDLNTLLTDPEVGPSNAMQAETMRKILHAALFAGAVGAGGRTAQGLGNFLGRNLGGPPKTPLRQSTIPIPVPVDPDRKPAPPRRPKFAALDPPASFAEKPLGWAAQHMANAVGTMKAPGEAMSSAGKLLTGWGAKSPKDMPWAYPAGAAAVGAGLYGGYKLTDWLLDKARRNEVDSELEQARREYQEAMMGQYGQKAASPDPVDELYDVAEKRAFLGGVVGPAVGLGLLGMGTVGLGSGVAAYNWGRKQSKSKALEEAIRRRQEALFAQAPRPIMALPVPHDAGGPAAMPGEEDEEEFAKAGQLAQAADQVLQRFQQQKQQAAQTWQVMLNGPPKGGDKQPKPQEPQAPQLPTLAGAYSRTAGQPA